MEREAARLHSRPKRYTGRVSRVLLLFLIACGATLFGCPQAAQKAYLRCQQPKGSPCMSQQWFAGKLEQTPVSPWLSKPHFWRFRRAGRTVGVMLMGHPRDRMTSTLSHAIHSSLHEISSPKGLLATGVMQNIYPLGIYTKRRERALLSTWDDILSYLQASGRLKMHDTSAVRAHNVVTSLRNQIAAFYQSSQLRTVLYFQRDYKDGPLVIPYFSIASPPVPYVLRLSQSALPKDRARILGQLYFRVRLRKTMPLIDVLWKDHYAHNRKVEKQLYPTQMQCEYKWYNLFTAAKKGIRSHRVHLHVEREGDGKKRLRFYCTPKRLEEFRRTSQVLVRLRKHRQTLIKLNQSFQQFSYFHTLSKRRIKSNANLNTSVAIDGILRQHTLYYPQKVELNGKMIDPATLFASWQKRFYKDAWRNIHKHAKNSGQFLETNAKHPAGIFDKENTIFSAKIVGDEYQVMPYAVVQGSFAIALDRRRGVIELLTRRKAYPFVGRRSLDAKKTSNAQKRLSLRQTIERTCDGRLTLVHAATVKDVPAPAPALPPRSFLIKEGFLWLRLDDTLTVIPIAGANALKAPVKRELIRQVETAMSQRDAIPQHIKVLTISGNTPNLKISFPGDK